MADASDHRVQPERAVKPRKPTSNADRPIYAYDGANACDENGNTYYVDDLMTVLRTATPSIVVSIPESIALLKRLQARYGHDPNFQFRVAPIERETFTGKNGPHRWALNLTSIAFFGWVKEKCGRNNTIRNRYHLLIDPVTFSNGALDERTLEAHMAWMQEIRAFCIAQNWNLRPTQGSVARQALTDARFYPEPRRKVPRATNERVRKVLPGNHYQLGEGTRLEQEYAADYLDQSRCHHYHAIQAKLPDSNSLYGFGNFRDPDSCKRWRDTPERIASFLDGFMGLCHGTIYWPLSTRKTTTLLPRFLREWEPGKSVYFYSEDLPLFESLRIRITSLTAAWGSKREDTGLAKYARWALNELDTNGAPAWKKTLLLSPYGALATTARKHQVGFHRSEGGQRRHLRSKSGVQIEASVHETTRVAEPSTNNVLHRALIEASNRTETLLYAQYLEQLGYCVLCVYVDGILVEQDEDLSRPLLAPWRLDRTLTGLRFLSETQFVSSELRKLPGVTGDQRRKLSVGQGRGAKLGTRKDMERRVQQAKEDLWNRNTDSTQVRSR